MGIFSFIKESIQAGYEEAQEEHNQEVASYLQIKDSPVTAEKRALALACPFRKVLISSKMGGFSPHLYKLGVLDEKEKESTKKLLQRDLDITDMESLHQNTMNVILQLFAELENDEAGDKEVLFDLLVAAASIDLYAITAGIDVGYVTWEEMSPHITMLMEVVLKQSDTHSWQQFGERFLRGERELGFNNALGRKLLESRVEWLLQDEESPWINIQWEEL